MRGGFVLNTGAFALSTTAKTALNIIAGADKSIIIVEFGVSIEAASGRCLVELFESTQATAGTAGASTGAKRIRGHVSGTDAAPIETYGREFSAEPTVLTVLKQWVFPAPGPFVLQHPLGREVHSLVSGATKYKALGLRLTVDTGTPNSRSYMEWE